jgi:hypothetical protein
VKLDSFFLLFWLLPEEEKLQIIMKLSSLLRVNFGPRPCAMAEGMCVPRPGSEVPCHGEMAKKMGNAVDLMSLRLDSAYAGTGWASGRTNGQGGNEVEAGAGSGDEHGGMWERSWECSWDAAAIIHQMYSRVMWE